jgi:hypothetical protein
MGVLDCIEGLRNPGDVYSASPLLTEVIYASVVFVVQIDDFLIHGGFLLEITTKSAGSSLASTKVSSVSSGHSPLCIGVRVR